MRNVTLAIEEDILQKARVRAAREGTSVNEVIRRYLAEYGGREDRIRAAMDRVLEEAAKYHGRSVGRRWTREEIHERKPPRGS